MTKELARTIKEIRLKADEIDTEYQDNCICPYCGYEDVDTWEYNFKGDEYKTKCLNCNKNIIVIENRSVTYSTYKDTSK